MTSEERETNEDAQSQYTEYEKKLKAGQSIPKKKILANSKAGEVRKSTGAAVREYYKNEN